MISFRSENQFAESKSARNVRGYSIAKFIFQIEKTAVLQAGATLAPDGKPPPSCCCVDSEQVVLEKRPTKVWGPRVNRGRLYSLRGSYVTVNSGNGNYQYHCNGEKNTVLGHVL